MKALKKLPITYKGELHGVKLINFSVDLEEVINKVPKGIKVRDFDGRVIISMVNVKLKQMRPKGMPKALSFDYQHVAFRLLVDDSEYNDGDCKGIYFLRSFTDKPWVAWSGSHFTYYQLTQAAISESEGFRLAQDSRYVKYKLTKKVAGLERDLKAIIQPLDRAYAVDGQDLLRTKIQREAWPIEPVPCEGFETNFFRTAKYLGAFEVKKMIDYEWLAPVII